MSDQYLVGTVQEETHSRIGSCMSENLKVGLILGGIAVNAVALVFAPIMAIGTLIVTYEIGIRMIESDKKKSCTNCQCKK